MRDHAILQILATYGLRAGEIRNLRLEDIDWRTEAIRVRHSKTQACSFVPLTGLPETASALDCIRRSFVSLKLPSRSCRSRA
ncbi:tyrosine-type recombinase/integrase [Mesorhizobium sp. M1006]|uniref:tyrosine-type recombinase/integrase n=1 Tax=Mesorhizobium sp. M1006 TaxID=2957048 RepID=UPI00333DFEF4